MLSREEIEQMINQKIEQKIEPLTEEIASLKAQLGKVDLLTIDNRNIRQSLGRIETAQESLKLDFERQEKRIVHFERQTNAQFTEIKADTTVLKADVTALKADTTVLKADVTALKADTTVLKADTTVLKADVTALKADTTVLKADTTALKEQLALVVTMLRRALPPEEQR